MKIILLTFVVFTVMRILGVVSGFILQVDTNARLVVGRIYCHHL